MVSFFLIRCRPAINGALLEDSMEDKYSGSVTCELYHFFRVAIVHIPDVRSSVFRCIYSKAAMKESFCLEILLLIEENFNHGKDYKFTVFL